jgi:Fic family protein
VQKLVEDELAKNPGINVCTPDFIRWIHREFYDRLPPELRLVRDPETGREEIVIPGELRHYLVKVGKHLPAEPDELPSLLERFAAVYDPGSRSREEALAALGAAHHRLLWIHPFGDGNGRVTRLMTDAYLRRIGMGGHGLWTASRGLARSRDEYKARLANADGPRWDDYDGRGALSLKALTEFCDFFLTICADQIAYMASILEVDGLADRALKYGKAREVGVLEGPEKTRWRPEATSFLRNLIYRGSIPRGEVETLTHLSSRTARRLVSDLTAEGFITSETSRAPLRVRIPAHAGPHLLPGLYRIESGS